MKNEYIIDLKRVRAAKTVNARIAAALPAPEGYGCNYDALFDLLTEYGAGWRIVFRHAAPSLTTLREVCADAVADTPGLEVVFE